jgi:hypothetical protein
MITTFVRGFTKGAFLALACFAVSAQVSADILEKWTGQQLCTNYYGLEYLEYGAGRFVAFGWYSDIGVLLSSEDGKKWDLRMDGSRPGPEQGLSYSTGFAYSEPYFLALGGFGISAFSSDGVTWNVFDFGPIPVSAAFGNGVTVIVANDSDVYTTTNLFSSQFTPQHANLTLGDIVFGSGKFVAVGAGTNSGHVYRSSRGRVWTSADIPGGSRISFANGLFVIPYGPGTNLISTDGANWATLNTGTSGLWMGKIHFANGIFFSTAGNYLATSADGTNWISYANPMPGYVFASDGVRMVSIASEPVPVDWIRFDSFAYFSDPMVDLKMNRTPVSVVLSGLVGRTYQIESADELKSNGTNNWQVRFSGKLPSNPFIWSDLSAPSGTMRFYRAALEQ